MGFDPVFGDWNNGFEVLREQERVKHNWVLTIRVLLDLFGHG